VSTRGVALSITGCRLKTSPPGFSFIGNPAGRPVQHAPTLMLKLSDAVFSTARKIQELR
jgi:hypothetical protein